MKKTLLYGLALLMAAGLSFNSCKKDGGETVAPPTEENLAPTDPQMKTALIEDFTGVRCQFCPDGHRISKELEEANPGKVLTIAVHAGIYSTPGQDNQGHVFPDFRTAFGTALNDQAGVTGYPAGTVNRHVFDASFSPMKAGGMAMGRGSWSMATENIRTQNAPVNLGMKTSWDEASRTLSVTAETYYTSDETVPNNLNVALTENGVVGMQINYYTQSYDPAYVHNNMLRSLLTGQWGEPITTTTKGSRFKKTFNYVVPATVNIANCDVIAFVTEGKVEVLNALKVKAKM